MTKWKKMNIIQKYSKLTNYSINIKIWKLSNNSNYY